MEKAELSAPPDVTRLLGLNTTDMITAVREGLPFKTFERLRILLGLTVQEMGDVLSIPERTSLRRKKAGRLSPEESDRLVRLAQLAQLTLVVFDYDSGRAVKWLTEPKSRLRGESPIVHADTEPGAREVEDMLYSIEFTMPA